MLSFLFAKKDKEDEKLNNIYSKLKKYYSYSDISEDRKEYLAKTVSKYGFTEIRTPVFEHTELFQRGIGDTTDVVQKEMYTYKMAKRRLFPKRGICF